MTTADRAKPGYRAWQQKVRGRAARRLQHAHPDQWRQLLAEEQAAEPFTPPTKDTKMTAYPSPALTAGVRTLLDGLDTISAGSDNPDPATLDAMANLGCFIDPSHHDPLTWTVVDTRTDQTAVVGWDETGPSPRVWWEDR